MMARGLAALAAIAVTLLLAAPAYAQDEPPAPPPAPPPEVTPAPPRAAAPAAAEALNRYAKKGVIEIEGGIGFSYQKGGTYDFGLYPAGRYFIIDGLSVGLKLDIGYAKSGDATGSFTTTNVGLVPMAEYDLNLGGRLFPYANLGFGFSYTKFTMSGAGGSGVNLGVCDIGAGVKMVFGHGGTLGLGIGFPVYFNDEGSSWAFQILTRYSIFFSL